MDPSVEFRPARTIFYVASSGPECLRLRNVVAPDGVFSTDESWVGQVGGRLVPDRPPAVVVVVVVSVDAERA
jgi:hypothetical protein